MNVIICRNYNKFGEETGLMVYDETTNMQEVFDRFEAFKLSEGSWASTRTISYLAFSDGTRIEIQLHKVIVVGEYE